ncbi:hypothetical protein TRM7557_01061 [Tritonibacter multivorans]|uniref:Pentapeptide repeat-containing protein n=1 Tax=Tritonibacter multivorans TaxID=928856 RepID=A0A0P1GQ98_9RHOB|nr:hypothetical protein [Tritonibacter multivorans]MDA7421833.1 hypothetical protein [Tritonibacter multivorans]CUH76787.1 hypothetical protein TRM7557_01061 [Tritonibacter multivorans]SFD06883.1 hypothetical protein SAMN04488049_106146 [Tritonibacter multivorans]
MKDESETPEAGRDTPRELKPANENPWYILMTLYGEQKGHKIDWELHEKNRKAWNAWSGQFLSDEEKAKAAKSSKIDIAELEAWPERRKELQNELERVFLERNPVAREIIVPSLGGPNVSVDMGRVSLVYKMIFTGMVFGTNISFDSAEFVRSSVFDFATFVKGSHFGQSLFSESVSFESTMFAQESRFVGVTFKRTASFFSAVFEGFSEFIGVSFAEQVSFERAVFESEVMFDSGKFSRALFKKTIFCEGANFEAVAFLHATRFDDVRFEKTASFEYAVFKGVTTFAGVKFGGETSFERTVFEEAISFQSGGFSQASFKQAKFSQSAIFNNVAFTQAASFEQASFMEVAKFDLSTFEKEISFHFANFEGYPYFMGTRFGVKGGAVCKADFTNAHFLKPTNFRDAVFLHRFPILAGSIIHSQTSFTAGNDNWPTDKEKLSSEEIEVARESCAVIRHALAKQGLPEDEHFFFRREMQFARQIGTRLERLPYQLFGWLSEYGYSIERPLLWLLGIWVTGYCFFATLFFHEDFGGDAAGAGNWTAAGLSLSNLFPVFGFGRLYFGKDFMEVMPWEVQVFSGFQTVAALPLLFFLGLALRQRFRLR